MKALVVIERRTYYWDGYILELSGITHYRAYGRLHHLRTMDGRYHIVNEGWLHLEIETTDEAKL